MTTVVLGAGLAGLAAAERLRENGQPVLVLEARSQIGGHASSINRAGFTFDEGPHVLFSQDEEVVAALTRYTGAEETRDARILNFFEGGWIPHPVQCNLVAVPPEIAAACVLDFLDAPAIDAPQNYADWCYAALGRRISETFTFPYTRKYWGTEPQDLSTEWVGERVYRPSVEEVVKGALVARTASAQHYITQFRYPSFDGFGAFARSFELAGVLELQSTVASIDHQRNTITLSTGRTLRYDSLISTMPLPALVDIIDDVPHVVTAAARRLIATSVVLVDLSLRTPPRTDAHWFYAYDKDLPFARCSMPHLLSPSTVPQGCGSIQAEVYYSSSKPLVGSLEDLRTSVINGLIATGLITAHDILAADVRVVKFANVIFDHHRRESVEIVRNWLGGVAGVLLAGRYGLWEYLWSDGAVRSGWRASDAVLGGTTLAEITT